MSNSNWDKPPPIVIISGSDEFARYHEISQAIKSCARTGRQFVRLGEGETLQSFLHESIFFTERSLVLVDGKSKYEAKTLLEHYKQSRSMVSLLIHYEGELPQKGEAAKLAEGMSPKHVARFKAPPPWEKEPRATEFLQQEAMKRNLQLGKDLAVSMVKTLGTDRGVLSFELDKLHLYLGEGGVITPESIKSTSAMLTEVSVFPCIEAFGKRDRNALLRMLMLFRRSVGGEQSKLVMRVIGLLIKNISQWIVACSLQSKNRSDEIASALEVSPYIVKTSIAPIALRWDESSLVGILRRVVNVENGVKQGEIAPWTHLESLLIQAVLT